MLTACRLGLFEAIGTSRLTDAEVSQRLGLDSGETPFFLDALVAVGLLVKRRGRYAASAVARRRLLEGGENYLGGLFRHQHRMLLLWARLADLLRSGEDPGEGGESAERDFVLAMEANAQRNGPRIAAAVDLEGASRLLDLGGGPGTYARLFLGRHPGLTALVLDRPGVVAVARSLPINRGWGDRLLFRGGDFLEDDLGRGYDVIWISNVIHSLGPAQVSILLPRCQAALRPGGRLLVHDFLLDEAGVSPSRAALFSVHMRLATTDGRTYRRDQILGQVEDAGFPRPRVIATFAASAIVEGRRPSPP